LTVAVAANYTNIVAGFVLNFTAQISGHATLNFWDFDDGTFAFDQAAGLSHRFTGAGEYAVTLRAYNDGLPNGVGATVIIHVSANSVHYVSAGSTNPAVPYISWATAATNIQDAIEAAFAGGAIFVTNGTYATGGRVVSGITNRVVVGQAVDGAECQWAAVHASQRRARNPLRVSSRRHQLDRVHLDQWDCGQWRRGVV
jgi:PKD repeat protein